ncbi:MAG: polysaccharide biosynthesis tyrosine autokinase [Desulfobacterales bacterium]
MGKLTKALDKFAAEPKSQRIRNLTPNDIELLLAHNRKTGRLSTDNRGFDPLKEQETHHESIERLLENNMIDPGGNLTPKGFEEVKRMEQIIRPETIETVRMRKDAHGESRSVDYGNDYQQVEFSAKPQKHAPADQKMHTEKKTERDDSSIRSSEVKIAPVSRRHPIKKQPDRMLVSLLNQHSYEAEQFKILRTSIMYPLAGNAPKTILVTSALPGEGKSFLSSNLAVSIALDINKHVLLIDCDLRNPSLHHFFGFNAGRGLSDYLNGETDLSDLMLRLNGIDRLSLLPAGTLPPNPSELVSTEQMAAFMEEAKQRYNDRMIILDSPPQAIAAESAYLARIVDGIIIVVKYGRTPRQEIEDMVTNIGTDKIIGVVVNQMDLSVPQSSGYSKYGYAKRYYTAHSQKGLISRLFKTR